MLTRIPQASLPNRRVERPSARHAVPANVCLMANHRGGAVP